MKSITQTVVVCLLALTLFASVSNSQSKRNASIDPNVAAARVAVLSRSIVAGAARGRDVQSAARERFELMRALAEADPARALEAALPAEVLERTPANSRNYFETGEQLEGELDHQQANQRVK